MSDRMDASLSFPCYMESTVRKVFAQLAVNVESGMSAARITSVTVHETSKATEIPMRTREMLIRLAAEAIQQAASLPEN